MLRRIKEEHVVVQYLNTRLDSIIDTPTEQKQIYELMCLNWSSENLHDTNARNNPIGSNPDIVTLSSQALNKLVSSKPNWAQDIIVEVN